MQTEPIVSQFGMFVFEPDKKPTHKIYRFRIYDRGINPLLMPERQRKNMNFQVCGNRGEFLVLRIYFDAQQHIQDVRCYFFPDFDFEMAEYISRALVGWLRKKHKLSENIRYKFWEVYK